MAVYTPSMEDICYTRPWVQQLCHTVMPHYGLSIIRLTVYEYCFLGCDTILTDTNISEDPTPSIFSPHNTQQGGAVQEFPNTLSYNVC
jgi:hypothetical protein